MSEVENGLSMEVKQRFADAYAFFRTTDSTQRHKSTNQTWQFENVPPSWDNVVMAFEESN